MEMDPDSVLPTACNFISSKRTGESGEHIEWMDEEMLRKSHRSLKFIEGDISSNSGMFLAFVRPSLNHLLQSYIHLGA